MTPDLLREVAIAPALGILGGRYASPQAETLLVAIALQESGLRHRRQVGGPAKGWWQFEVIGVRGVLMHKATKNEAARVCRVLGVSQTPAELHRAIEQNDVLAACFARLLLWSDPRPLPGDEAPAWGYYLRNWRPGKPDENRWPEAWARAVETVYG